jgi:hypothetical protein
VQAAHPAVVSAAVHGRRIGGGAPHDGGLHPPRRASEPTGDTPSSHVPFHFQLGFLSRSFSHLTDPHSRSALPHDRARRRGLREDAPGEEPRPGAATSVSGRARSLEWRRSQLSTMSPLVMPDEFVETATATTVPSPRAVTPSSWPPAGAGVAMMLHLVPLKCRIAAVLAKGIPTAQTSLPASAEKPVIRPDHRRLAARGTRGCARFRR